MAHVRQHTRDCDGCRNTFPSNELKPYRKSKFVPGSKRSYYKIKNGSRTKTGESETASRITTTELLLCPKCHKMASNAGCFWAMVKIGAFGAVASMFLMANDSDEPSQTNHYDQHANLYESDLQEHPQIGMDTSSAASNREQSNISTEPETITLETTNRRLESAQQIDGLIVAYTVGFDVELPIHRLIILDCKRNLYSIHAESMESVYLKDTLSELSSDQFYMKQEDPKLSDANELAELRSILCF